MYGFDAYQRALSALSPQPGGFWTAERYLEGHRRRFAATLEILQSLKLRDPVLELGYGFGFITQAVKKLFEPGIFVAGDLNTSFVKPASAVLVAQGVQLVWTDLSKGLLPFKDDSFSTILIFELIEHLPSRINELAAELARILRPGGRLVLSTPNIASLGNRVRLAIGFNPVDFWIDKPTYARHYREYTKAELARLFEKAGLETTYVKFINAYASRFPRILSHAVPDSKDTIVALFCKSSNDERTPPPELLPTKGSRPA